MLAFLNLLFLNIYSPYFFNYIFQKILHNWKSETRYVYHWTVTYYGKKKTNHKSVLNKIKINTIKRTMTLLLFITSENGPELLQLYPIFLVQ